MPAHPTRRAFIALSATAALAATASAQNKVPPVPENKPALPGQPPSGPFMLEPLPYTNDALIPHIDAMTMDIHHNKHHRAYVTGLNTALKDFPAQGTKSLAELVGSIPFLPEPLQTPMRNHGGGHWNHHFFWNSMAKPGQPGIGGEPTDEALTAALVKAFGSVEAFKTKFNDAAAKRFGSGWSWLILKEDGTLAVVSTPNQDNPLMQGIVPNTDRGTPLLGLDVWEHAYYLNYQNKRPDYVKAWWNLVNWPTVATRYTEALAALKKK